MTNVTSLLKTVKSVEDEATRGTRALESTIEAIGQEIKVNKEWDVVIFLNFQTDSLCKQCSPRPDPKVTKLFHAQLS